MDGGREGGKEGMRESGSKRRESKEWTEKEKCERWALREGGREREKGGS